MLECLRIRVGLVLLRLERSVLLVRALALMDPAAVEWAKTGLAPPDSQVLEGIANGSLSPLEGFNLGSTRHLVSFFDHLCCVCL